MNAQVMPRHARLLFEAASRSAVRIRPESLTRAATAKAFALLGQEPDDILADDLGAAAVLRAAVSPHTAANSAALTQAALAAFLSDLAPVSAAAALISRAGVTVSAMPSTINLPRLDTSSAAAWINGLDAIPVIGASLGMATLHRRKLAAISVLSAELMKSSTAPQVVDGLLRRAAAAALDTAMFDETAGDDDRPAGLLYGVTPLTAFPGDDATARKADLTALVGALSPVSAEIALVVHPVRALSLSLDGIDLGFPVFPSAHIDQGTVIGLVLPALAAWAGDVEIDTSRDTTLHMSDDAQPILNSGTADPVRSMYQTDTVATRLIMEAGWTMQASNAVAVVEGASW